MPIRRLALALLLLATPAAAEPCRGTLYLTIDTGWMSEAEQIADVLRRQQVKATLFIADERTFRGDTTLSDSWADFWRARVAEGHAFGSHTLRHWYFRADPDPAHVTYQSFDRRQSTTLDQQQLCAELQAPGERLRAMTGASLTPGLWRAPGGGATPNARKFAAACGFTRHERWSDAGFLGDELPSERYPNRALLARALASIKDGDVLMMHWGIRSRREKFAAVLEPLIVGLKDRGFCFATLAERGAP